MRPFLLGSTLALVASNAFANITICQLEQYAGATDEVAQNWLGTHFRVNTERKIITVRRPDMYTVELKVKRVKRSDEFTTYISFRRNKAENGDVYRDRYAFRIYDDGRARAEITASGYEALKAVGTCR